MHGKPFVLFGVNSDETQERLREVINREQMPWRSWWEGPNRPIAVQWRVKTWPTLVVIDRDGVIRFRGNSRRALEKTVKGLLDGE